MRTGWCSCAHVHAQLYPMPVIPMRRRITVYTGIITLPRSYSVDLDVGSNLRVMCRYCTDLGSHRGWRTKSWVAKSIELRGEAGRTVTSGHRRRQVATPKFPVFQEWPLVTGSVSSTLFEQFPADSPTLLGPRISSATTRQPTPNPDCQTSSPN